MSTMTIDELEHVSAIFADLPLIRGHRYRVTATYSASQVPVSFPGEIDRLAVVHGGAAYMVGDNLQVIVSVVVDVDGDASQRLAAALAAAEPILDDVSDALGRHWSLMDASVRRSAT